MAGVQKIQYQGKEIIYIDYRGLFEDKMIEVLNQAESIILSDNKPFLLLTNISKAFATPGFTAAAKEFGKKTKSLLTKGAVVGISGGKKILLQTANIVLGGNLKPFDTEEEAKEYLVK